MIDLGFVVLNYKNYQETFYCVESILKQKNVNPYVCIVDNGSNNGSVEFLRDKYQSNNSIEIIPLPDNVGYAQGNNAGIDYFLRKKIDNIVICNSDVEFSTPNISMQMVSAEQDDVGLINPTIKNIDGSVDQRVVYKKALFGCRVFKKIIESICYKIRKPSETTSSKSNYKEVISDQVQFGKNVDCFVVAGSCFMLTPQFFKYFHGLFPETFLYFEEWATMILLHKANLNTKLIQTDPVIHKGAASTPNKTNSDWKQQMAAQSARKVLKLLLSSKRKILKDYGR